MNKFNYFILLFVMFGISLKSYGADLSKLEEKLIHVQGKRTTLESTIRAQEEELKKLELSQSSYLWSYTLGFIYEDENASKLKKLTQEINENKIHLGKEISKESDIRAQIFEEKKNEEKLTQAKRAEEIQKAEELRRAEEMKKAEESALAKLAEKKRQKLLIDEQKEIVAEPVIEPEFEPVKVIEEPEIIPPQILKEGDSGTCKVVALKSSGYSDEYKLDLKESKKKGELPILSCKRGRDRARFERCGDLISFSDTFEDICFRIGKKVLSYRSFSIKVVTRQKNDGKFQDYEIQKMSTVRGMILSEKERLRYNHETQYQEYRESCDKGKYRFNILEKLGGNISLALVSLYNKAFNRKCNFKGCPNREHSRFEPQSNNGCKYHVNKLGYKERGPISALMRLISRLRGY